VRSAKEKIVLFELYKNIRIIKLIIYNLHFHKIYSHLYYIIVFFLSSNRSTAHNTQQEHRAAAIELLLLVHGHGPHDPPPPRHMYRVSPAFGGAAVCWII